VKTKNQFVFNDKYKDKKGELYNFYKNMLSISCFGRISNKCCNCNTAARNSHLECLKYFRAKNPIWNNKLGMYTYTLTNFWASDACAYAAVNGHLKCLKYLHENLCIWEKDTCSNAAQNGHLECLKYAHENGCPWDKETCENAAKNGHLECLQYAHKNDCPWDGNTCGIALANGHIKCFTYLLKCNISGFVDIFRCGVYTNEIQRM
jgi:hypothetical protein